jgi:hypothetical protein
VQATKDELISLKFRICEQIFAIKTRALLRKMKEAKELKAGFKANHLSIL